MEDITFTIDDFGSICRGCLCSCTEGQSFNLYDLLVFENPVVDIFSKCVSIQISKNDILPKQLCQHCVSELTTCYNFINLCHKSQHTLLNILNQKQTGIKVEKVETLSDDEIRELDESTSDPTTGKLPGKPTFNCQLCGATFTSGANLKAHRATHTTKPPFVCLFCQKGFVKRLELKRHLDWHTRRESKEKILDKKTDSSEIPCSQCNKTFANKTILKTHEKKRHAERRFLCTECGDRFHTSTDLKVHQRRHTKETPFRCDYCGKTFRQIASFNRHSFIHTGEKPYVCKECGKEFKQLTNLKSHVRSMHRGEKPHKCSFCEKPFGRRTQLVEHERTHTGEKPFVCEVCEMEFTSGQRRNVHFRKHHGAVKEEGDGG